MHKETNLILCVLITLLLVGRGSATVIPALDLRSLVDAADIIAVGQITQITDTGKMPMNIRGHDMLVSVMKVQIRVDKVIKGNSEANIEFQLPLPEGMGYRSVPRDSYRLVFLKQEAGHLKPASPYYPSFPAVSDYSVRGGSPFEAVTGEIAAVLRSPHAPDSDKTEAIWRGLRWDLRTRELDVIKQALQFAAVQDANVSVRMSAVATLLAQNDLSVLPLAEQALSSTGSALPDDLRQNLSSSISEGVKGDAAVPTLTRLLANPDVRVRRGATMALRNTKTKRAIKGLTLALDDSDNKVRYYAVIGLAETTGEKGWRPSEEMFKSNENQYLQHWKSKAVSPH